MKTSVKNKGNANIDGESFLQVKKRNLVAKLVLIAGIILTPLSLLGGVNDQHQLMFLWWPGLLLLIIGAVMTWYYTMQVYKHEAFSALPTVNGVGPVVEPKPKEEHGTCGTAYCRFCGRRITMGSVFCEDCGSKLEL